jgi:hypothetical protein
VHDIKRPVWFEQHATMEPAIVREKRIKKWLRRWERLAPRVLPSAVFRNRGITEGDQEVTVR